MTDPGGGFRGVAWRPPRDEAELRRALNAALDEAAAAARSREASRPEERAEPQEGAWPQFARTESARPEAPRPEAARADPARANLARPEPQTADSPRAYLARPEPQTADPPRAYLARPDPEPPERHRAPSRLIVTLALAALGLVLVAAGILLVSDTLTGRNLFDEARLTSFWPLVISIAGVVVIAEAAALDRGGGRGGAPAGVGRPGTGAGAVPGPVAPERGWPGTSEWPAPGEPPAGEPAPAPFAPILGPFMPAPVAVPPAPEPSVPTRAAAFAAPGSIPPAPVPRAQAAGRPSPEAARRPSDLVAELLTLKAMRRDGLISKKQYRAGRRALVAGMTLGSAGLSWSGPLAGDEPGRGADSPLAYWGPTVR